MSSPFTVFRRYDRVLMVILTGLALLTFVLGGAVQDPRELSPKMVVLFLAATGGVIAWLSGLGKGKGTEWGLTGALIGAAIGLAFTFYSRETSVVVIDGRGMNSQQYFQLRRDLNVANQFLQQAYYQSGPRNPYEAYFTLPRYLFNYGGSPDEVSGPDAIGSEVLRREANKIGLVVSDKQVFDYLKEMTGGKLTAQQFDKVRQQMGISETELLKILREQIQARRTLELVSGRSYFTPDMYWKYYEQMNIRQTAEVAAIPVSSFLGEVGTPTPADLQALFEQYRSNYPGFDQQGRPVEGLPGFQQPRRIQLGYFEAAPEDFRSVVGEVTDEEIQTRYDDRYKRSVPTDDPADRPQLELQLPELPPVTPAPSGDAAPAVDSALKAEPAEETAPESTSPPPASGDGMAEFPDMSRLKPVAFYQDEETKPAQQEPAAESSPETATPKAAEKTAEKTADESSAPAGTEPPAASGAESSIPSGSEAPEPAAEAPSESQTTPDSGALPPPAPTSDTPVLDDVLKSQFREDILRERMNAEVRKATEAASAFMSTLSDQMHLPEGDSKRLTQEQAQKKLEEYAKEHHLTYVVTPPLSAVEMLDSEDYPIGRAYVVLASGGQTVADVIFQTAPIDLWRPETAASFQTESGFAFWKTHDREAYVPQTLDDDPIIRAEVEKTWKMRKAEPLAKARAAELAKRIRESDRPMAEVLANDTITGQEGSLFLTIRDLPDFTWMQRSSAPQTNMLQAPQVRESVVPGVDNPGSLFFHTVFEELNVGQTGVAPNRDNSEFYVVKITSRNPETPEQQQTFRDAFMKSNVPAAYSSLMTDTMMRLGGNPLAMLFSQYNVEFLENPATLD